MSNAGHAVLRPVIKISRSCCLEAVEADVNIRDDELPILRCWTKVRSGMAKINQKADTFGECASYVILEPFLHVYQPIYFGSDRYVYCNVWNGHVNIPLLGKQISAHRGTEPRPRVPVHLQLQNDTTDSSLLQRPLQCANDLVELRKKAAIGVARRGRTETITAAQILSTTVRAALLHSLRVYC